MRHTTILIALGACLFCAALPVEAHGNLGLPPWAGTAILAYLMCFALLLLASILASTHTGSARWLRFAVPLSMVAAMAISYVTARDNHSMHDQFVEAFAALLLPAFFTCLWLLGVILRWHRGG